MFVGGHGGQVHSATQIPLPSLAVGEKVTAQVLGPTRHGLSISIGQDTFHLTSPTQLADAKTLTLQAVGGAAGGHSDVRILAQDDHPLERPVLAKVTLPTTASPSAAGAIVQKGALEVSVAPLNAEGKVVGPSLSVLLQTATPQAEAQGHTGAGQAEGREPIETGPEPQRPISNQVNEQARPLTLARNQGTAPAGQGMPPGHPASFLDRALAQDKPTAPTSIQAAVDLHRRADDAKAVLVEGKSITKVEPRGGFPASFVASAASLLSSLKNAVAGGEAGPDTSRQALTAPPSLPAVEGTSAQPTKHVPGGMTPSLPNESGRGTVHWSGSSSPTTSRVEPRIGHDRGLATTAVVVARTPAENVVLKAEGQLFKVEQSLDLPLGTTLRATFSSSPTAVAMSTQGQVSETRATLLNQLISLLDNIDQASRHDAAAGGTETKRHLPMPDRHLASNLLSLLRLGDESVSNDDLPSSQRQSPLPESQQDKVQGLLRDLRGASAEPLADGWKSTTLPFGHDQGQAVMLYVREQPLDPEDRGATQDPEQGDIQRAVFDVSFSQLGRCQIDVLCQGKRFDLLMRNDTLLSAHDQQVISVLFRSACDVAGVTGEINFKIGDFFEPTPAPMPGKSLMT